jgi:hypothetical protein
MSSWKSFGLTFKILSGRFNQFSCHHAASVNAGFLLLVEAEI